MTAFFDAGPAEADGRSFLTGFTSVKMQEESLQEVLVRLAAAGKAWQASVASSTVEGTGHCSPPYSPSNGDLEAFKAAVQPACIGTGFWDTLAEQDVSFRDVGR